MDSNKIGNFLAGAANEKEKQEIEAWRKASPANEEEFRKFEKVWYTPAAPVSFNPNVDNAWERVSTRLFKAEKGAHQPQKKGNRFINLTTTTWGIAAAISLLILSGVFLYILNQELSSSTLADMQSVATNLFEKKEINLADGTTVWLNQESTLQFPKGFTDSIREVYLHGEAFFEVKPMPEKPFIINAGDAKVQVIGTAFNLRTTKYKKVDLQVVSGSVQFSVKEAPSTSLILNAGESASVVENKIIPQTAHHNFLSWKTGEFIFEDNSLPEVFQALESYYPFHFKAADPQLLKCRLSARFKQQSLEEVLEVLDLTLNLSHNLDNQKKTITFSFQGKGPKCAGENL